MNKLLGPTVALIGSALLTMVQFARCADSSQTRRPNAAPASVDVGDSGVKADGVTVNTTGIQRAIDERSKLGGGIIHFPPGRYVSGTILLKDNVTLRLDDGALLLGSTNIADYQAPDKFRSGNGAEM